MWSLFENEKELKPLIFSNGKSQADVVKEVLDAVKEGYKIIFLKGQCGTGKCLDKNTLIFCKPCNEKNFSYYKISELLGKEGKILSLDKFGNIVESDFKNVRKNEIKALYNLKTRTGREIIASQNHPFLTLTSKGLEWLPLKDLNNQSYVCLPKKIHLNNSSELDDNKIKILAHLIAEGKLGDKAGSPVYTQNPKENSDTRKDYISSLKNIFPEGQIKEYSDNVKITFRLMDTRFGTTNKLRLFIREYGLDGKKSSEKFVPQIIFNLKEEKIALFLKILYSCDGSIYIKKKSSQTVIEYCSISERLIKDVSILLTILGIPHTITKKKFRNIKNYSKRITISNQKGVREFIEKIGFLGRKHDLALKVYRRLKNHKFTNIDKVPRILRNYLKNKGYSFLQMDRFLNHEEIEEKRKVLNYRQIRNNLSIKTPCVFTQIKIDFLREHLRTINKHINDDTLSFICNEHIIWDKIESIEYLKNEETYDLEVETYHNFIANGIIVHNSAIALNLARHLGKTSIVVPIKNLQEQYKEDYTNKKYLLHKGKKLKISSITGRKNFKCKFLEENSFLFKPKINERNSKLNEIFESYSIMKRDLTKNESSCDNNFIPCKIEIKEKNLNILKEYIKQNPEVDLTDFDSIKDIRRMTIAPVCPYWYPIVPEEIELRKFKDSKKITYLGLNNRKFSLYTRNKGCPYYEQYESYEDSDVIIFNSAKYIVESILNRKPATELEVIDECDDFLDNFSNEEQINLNRLLFSLNNIYSKNPSIINSINELIDTVNAIKTSNNLKDSGEIFDLKNTLVEELLQIILDNPEIIDELDEELNYINHLYKVAKIFEDFMNETFFSINKKENDLIIHLVTTNLEKRFKELVEKNKIFVLMSGTIHSENVLKNIFGLEKFKIIEAETDHQGELIKRRYGYELDCSYESFKKGLTTREQYLKSLSKCLFCAKKPILIHVHSFSDLPNEQEKISFNLENLPTQEHLINEQVKDPFGKRIKDFKDKKIDILFTTKCNRGIDFPGDVCNSIIITRFPYPNISEIFWKILKKNKPAYFMSFYMDKAKRELLQRVYRGLRSKNDRVFLLSPDVRVLDFGFN